MNSKRKRWISTPIGIVVFSLLPVAGSLGQITTPCDIELTQGIYQIGDTVEANVFRLTNASQETQFFEWKLWLESPDLSILSLVNMGSDMSLALPGGFDFDFAVFGNIQLFTADGVIFTSGNYELGCRLLDPVTGAEYPQADVIQFQVN